jgi:hypothetical protein
MELNIRAIKFSFDEDQKEFIEKKMQRVSYAEDLITDVTCSVKLDKKFIYECDVHFRFGEVAHVSTENYDFEAGVNKLMDMLDQKIKKEKDKIQEKN